MFGMKKKTLHRVTEQCFCVNGVEIITHVIYVFLFCAFEIRVQAALQRKRDHIFYLLCIKTDKNQAQSDGLRM